MYVTIGVKHTLSILSKANSLGGGEVCGASEGQMPPCILKMRGGTAIKTRTTFL